MQRFRKNLERGGHDHPERAQRAVMQLHHVVAADVLDHATTAGREPAVGKRDTNADQEISRRPVAEPQRSRPAGREQAADRVARRVERIER